MAARRPRASLRGAAALRPAAIALLLVAAAAPPALAQDDDGGLISNFLERNLSAVGRDVQIRGFEGALSRSATIEEMTIADDEGVWLTLRGARLDWNRAAVLRGRIEIEALTAEQLIVTRRPEPGPVPVTEKAPQPEASGFRLPELPVSVNIDQLGIEQVDLGAPVLGVPALLSLQGTLGLADGEGAARLVLERLDGPEDRISLAASFENESRFLSLDLVVRESAGGLIGRIAGIPGGPSLSLDVQGEGPLSDYRADIALASAGQERLSGAVVLGAAEGGGLRFNADVGGDITPLLPERFEAFFGEETALQAEGLSTPEGGFRLDRLRLATRSLEIGGDLSLGADGIVQHFDLAGQLAAPEGGPVVLPVAGPETQVDEASFSVTFDAAEGEAWSLQFLTEGLVRGALSLDELGLEGGGTISQETGAVTADLEFAAERLETGDPALTAAIGTAITGRASARFGEARGLELTGLTVAGEDYGLSLDGSLRPGEGTVRLDGSARLAAEDLSRFSGLAGRDLTGRAEIRLAGEGDPLGGLFDISLDLEGTGLGVGQEAADRLLEGAVTLSAAARRDTTGLTLERFALESAGITANGAGRLGGGESDLALSARLADVGLVAPQYSGPLELSGTVGEPEADVYDVTLDLDGPYGLAGTISGLLATGPRSGESDLSLDLSLPDVAPLAEGFSGPLALRGSAAETGDGQWRVDLDVETPYDGTAAVQGVVGAGRSDVALQVALPDVSPLAPGIEGPVSANGTAAETGEGQWRVDLDLGTPYEGTATVEGVVGGGRSDVALTAALPDIAPLAPGFTGAVALEGTAAETGTGQWRVDLGVDAPYGGTALVEGVVGAGRSALDYSLSLPDLAAVAPGVPGALEATGTAAETGRGGWRVTVDGTGPYAAAISAETVVGEGPLNADLTARLPDVSALAPGFSGTAEVQASVTQAEGGLWDVTATGTGPFGAEARVSGQVGAEAAALSFRAGLPSVAPIAAPLTGALLLEGTVDRAEAGPWQILADVGGPIGASGTVDAQVGAGQTAVSFDYAIPSLAPVVPGLGGPVSLTGSLRQGAQGWAVDVASRGPAAATAAVTGILAADFGTASLRASGAVPLALSDPFLAPNQLIGDASFTLSVDGPLALQSVNGTISTSGARLSLPTLEQALTGIEASISLSGGTASVQASAEGLQGGGLSASGSIGLSAPFPGDLQVALGGLVLSDPALYRTVLGGAITVTGPLAGGATIAGRIVPSETEIRVPDSGLGFGGTIPDITHVREPAASRLTRSRAGLLAEERRDGGGGGGGGGGPAYPLDLVIDAPRQIFIRGRGLDAELGGTITVGGTTAAPVPSGEIRLIRGRISILGKRLTLDPESRITLGGDLTPVLELAATSQSDDFDILIVIEGPVDAPEFSFRSSPELPEDEVLARFLFDRGIADLSALQAAQLAASIATLTGRGGGLLSGLREGIGVDDLDLDTNAEGQTELTVGKYLSDNIYTDVTTASGGRTEINLNIDVTDSLTIRGSASNEGKTSIGIFFEKDY